MAGVVDTHDLRREITRDVSSLHKRYFGRGATTGKTFFVHDDLILVELRDVYTTVEHTLISRGQSDAVKRTRRTFQEAMVAEFIGAIERATGRQVQSYESLAFIAPDRLLEIFVLEPEADRSSREKLEAEEDRGERERPAGGLRDDEF